MAVVTIKSDVLKNDENPCSNTAATSLSSYKHEKYLEDKHYDRSFPGMNSSKSNEI